MYVHACMSVMNGNFKNLFYSKFLKGFKNSYHYMSDAHTVTLLCLFITSSSFLNDILRFDSI